MSQLPDIRINSYSKKIGDRYSLVQFENAYKKRRKKKVNYELTLECTVTEEELQNFFTWFENTLDYGTSSFNATFEIIRDDELESYFFYKFLEAPTFSKKEGDEYSLTLNILRIVEACSFEFLQMLNALLNLQKNLRGENTGIEAHVSCPLIFQRIGVSLLNIKNLVEEHPNDYTVSRAFT